MHQEAGQVEYKVAAEELEEIVEFLEEMVIEPSVSIGRQTPPPIPADARRA